LVNPSTAPHPSCTRHGVVIDIGREHGHRDHRPRCLHRKRDGDNDHLPNRLTDAPALDHFALLSDSGLLRCPCVVVQLLPHYPVPRFVLDGVLRCGILIVRHGVLFALVLCLDGGPSANRPWPLEVVEAQTCLTAEMSRTSLTLSATSMLPLPSAWLKVMS
jgi:hypothetical protein